MALLVLGYHHLFDLATSFQDGQTRSIVETNIDNLVNCGHISLVKLLRNADITFRISSQSLTYAASHDKDDSFFWISNQFLNLSPSIQTSDFACSSGSISILEHLYQKNNILPSLKGVQTLCERNDLEGVRWLKERGEIPPISHLLNCSLNPTSPISFLTFLHHDCHIPISQESFNLSFKHGNLEVSMWLWGESEEEGDEEGGDLVPTARAIDLAASIGHIEAVQWLTTLPNFQPPTFYAIDKAAKGGHLKMVKFLLERFEGDFSSLSSSTLSKASLNAAKNGHLGTLKVQFKECFITHLIDFFAFNSCSQSGWTPSLMR